MRWGFDLISGHYQIISGRKLISFLFLFLIISTLLIHYELALIFIILLNINKYK